MAKEVKISELPLIKPDSAILRELEYETSVPILVRKSGLYDNYKLTTEDLLKYIEGELLEDDYVSIRDFNATINTIKLLINSKTEPSNLEEAIQNLEKKIASKYTTYEFITPLKQDHEVLYNKVINEYATLEFLRSNLQDIQEQFQSETVKRDAIVRHVDDLNADINSKIDLESANIGTRIDNLNKTIEDRIAALNVDYADKFLNYIGFDSFNSSLNSLRNLLIERISGVEELVLTNKNSINKEEHSYIVEAYKVTPTKEAPSNTYLTSTEYPPLGWSLSVDTNTIGYIWKISAKYYEKHRSFHVYNNLRIWSEAVCIGTTMSSSEQTTVIENINSLDVYFRTSLAPEVVCQDYYIPNLNVEALLEYLNNNTTYTQSVNGNSITYYKNPKGVDDVYINEYKCISENGNYKAPILIAHYGKDGASSSVEYNYIRTTSYLKPTIPSYNLASANYDGYTLKNWNNYPMGVDKGSRYEWVTMRKKVNGLWERFGGAVLWAYYSKDGVDGDAENSGIYLATIYCVSNTKPNTPTGGSYNFSNNSLKAPDGWEINVPSLGTVWQSLRNFFYNNQFISKWSTPIRIIRSSEELLSEGTKIYSLTITLYKNLEEGATMKPEKPSTSIVNINWNTNLYSVNTSSDWKENIGEDWNNIYKTTCTFFSDGTNTGWAGPFKFIEINIPKIEETEGIDEKIESAINLAISEETFKDSIVNAASESVINVVKNDEGLISAVVLGIGNNGSYVELLADKINLNGLVIADAIATDNLNIGNDSYIYGKNDPSGIAASFGNSSTLFNKDGSGLLANGIISWNKNSNGLFELEIKGNMHATNGVIGGWTIADNNGDYYLYSESNNNKLYLNPSQGIISTTGNITNYKLNTDGSGQLAGGHIQWNSDGSLAITPTPNADSVNNGIFIGNDGKVHLGSDVVLSWNNLPDNLATLNDVNTRAPRIKDGFWEYWDNEINDYYRTQYKAEGKDGTSVNIKGSFTSEDYLPTEDVNLGDGYLIDGNLYVYTGTGNIKNGYVNAGSIKGPKGDSAFSVVLLTDEGNIIKNGLGSITITAKVYKGGVDITLDIINYEMTHMSSDNKCFTWIRNSSDKDGDIAWNNQNLYQYDNGLKGNVLTIDNSQVLDKAMFECLVSIPDSI